MKTVLSALSALTAALVLACGAALFSPSALADDGEAAGTIASILAGFNHYPSAEDKAALTGIMDSTEVSDAMKAVAKAVHDMAHFASDEDKAALGDIMAAEDSGTAGELAAIVVGINHTPSTEAKAALQAML